MGEEGGRQEIITKKKRFKRALIDREADTMNEFVKKI